MPLSSVPDMEREDAAPHSMISAITRRYSVLRSRSRAWSVLGAVVGRRLLHLQEELVVALRLLHPVEEQLERLLGVECVQDAAQAPDDLQLVRRQQDLFLTRAGRVDVDRREDPLVRELAVELELHVSGALELLEDDLVHPRAGLDEGRRQDRQRAAVLDVARRAEEPLRRVERRRVDTAGEDPAAGGRREVVGTAEAGHRV